MLWEWERDSCQEIQGGLFERSHFLLALKDKQDLDIWRNMKRASRQKIWESVQQKWKK